MKTNDIVTFQNDGTNKIGKITWMSDKVAWVACEDGFKKKCNLSELTLKQ